MLIDQIIEFELRGTGSSGRTCALQLIIFMTKQISQNKIFEWIIIYRKILQEAMYLCSPISAKSLAKFDPKCRFQTFLDLNC